MKRTPRQWKEICVKEFKAGYTPGGKAADLYTSGQALARMLRDWGVWGKGDVLVDVGCGNGRLAMGLVDAHVAYYGLDIIPGSIEFCRKVFSGYAGFIFYLLDVRNAAYAPDNRTDPAEVTYPLKDALADVVVANSLFSHTETISAAERNLYEMHRVLKPKGRLWSTWRLVPPHAEVDRAARHTNYLREDALMLLKATGFEILKELDRLPREMPVAPEDSQTGFLAVRR